MRLDRGYKGMDQKSQEGSERETQEVGGYVAIYHDIEEMSYGPKLGLPAKWRVFFCIRHKLLRDGLCEKHIGTAFIMEKTGLTKPQIKAAIKALQEEGLVLSTQNTAMTSNGRGKQNIVYGENSYQLNPVVFGELYNWYKNNPTVRVYEGGEKTKQGRSYSAQGIHSDPGPESETGGGPESETGGVQKVRPGKGSNLAKLMEKFRSNNPSYNNPKENNPSYEGRKKRDLSLQGKGKQADWIKEPSRDDLENEKQRQLAMARREGIM